MFTRRATSTGVAIAALATSLAGAGLSAGTSTAFAQPAGGVSLTGGPAFPAHGPGPWDADCWGPDGWDPACYGPGSWDPGPWPGMMMGPGPGGPGMMGPGPWGPGMMGGH